MAGGDDEIRVSMSGDGDLPEVLARIEQRLKAVEDALGRTGKAGESSGDKVADGAGKAAAGMGRAEDAAESYARAVEELADESGTASRKLGETGKAAKSTAADLDDAGDKARQAARGLDDVGDQADAAAAGLKATEKGAEGAAEALDDTAREARKAARALDDAGDEAAEAGAKAAASAPFWQRLAERMDRGERISRRWASAQNAMRWSTWSDGLGRFTEKARGFVSIDWDKSSKKLNKLAKEFGGFSKVMTAFKFGAIVAGIFALLGALSALGAGAVGIVGGLGNIVVGLSALGPVLLSAMLAIKGVTAAMKEAEPEVKALKDQFGGFVTNIAAGGLREGLRSFAEDTVQLSRKVNTLGTYIGQSAKITLVAAGTYAKSADGLQRFGVIADGARTQVTDLGLTGVNALRLLTTVMAGASPVANRFTDDILRLTTNFANNIDQLYESGRMTAYLDNAYNNLVRAVSVLTDWLIGLYNIFRIGAQESRWMGDSIEASAAKFRSWTQSAEGQNSIRQYFADAMPAVRETGLLIRDLLVGFGQLATHQDIAPLINQIRVELLPALLTLASAFTSDLLPGLVDLATKLATLFSGLDFSGLAVLVVGLNAFLDAVIWASENIPGFNLVLSTLLTTLFLLGPAFKIAAMITGAFGRLGTVLAWIGKLPGISIIVKNLQMLWFVIGGWPGLFAKIGAGIVAVAQLIGRGLAAAFLSSNPIGWIILAVVAVVGAIWWLWENCQWFRDGVMTALGAVGDFFVWLGGKIMEGLGWVGDFFVGLWNGAVGAWNWFASTVASVWSGYIYPVLQAIGTALKWVAAIIFTIFVAPFVLAFNLLAALVTWWWNNVTWPVLQAAGAFFVWIFQNVIMPVVDFFVAAWNLAMAGLAYAYYGYVLPFLTVMGEFFSWLFTVVIMGVVNFFVNAWNLALGLVVAAYHLYIVPMMNALAAIFDWVVNTIIMPIIDWLTSRWDLAMLGFQLAYQMYIVPLMNAFGAIFNWLWSVIINPIIQWIQDRWAALGALFQMVYNNVIQPAFNAVSTGLGWLRDGFNNMINNIIEIWNRLRGGLAAPVNFIIGTIWNKGIMPTWNWIAEKLGLPKADPMAEIPAFATGGSVRGKGTGTSDDIPAMLSNGEHVWTAREVRKVGGHAQVERLRRMAATGSLQYYAEGGPVTPQQMHSTVAAVLPGTRLSSGFRQGDPGFHGRNRAADLAGPRSMDTAFMRRIDEFIGTKFPGSSELIHTPGPYNIKNGRPHTYSAGIRQDHYDHVHWANNGAAAGEGGGGIMTSFWDSIAKPALDAIINPVLSNIPFNGPPEFMNVPRKSGEKFRDDIYGWARGKFAAFDDFTGGIADSVSALAAQAQVRAAAMTFGWGFGSQWDAIMKLVQGESGWDTTAANPTSSARGLFQKMTSLHGPVESTAFGQGMWGLNYIKGAYGNPVNAYAKWSSRQPHWYDDGGYLPTGLSMVMNGTGSPEPVFTGGQWDTLSGLMDTQGLVAAMLATPQSFAAVQASDRERGGHDGGHEMAAVLGELRMLRQVVAERPPPVSAPENVREVIREEWNAHQRRERARRRYQYGDE